ncbi:MAG: alpha/beta hydrolase [Chloroflexi bacterium]|nr:alpha/beta hydrolase [Chloroflexota bacterium]
MLSIPNRVTWLPVAKVVEWTAPFIAGVVIILIVGFVARQTNLLDRYFLYFPEREIFLTPGNVGLVYEDVFISTSDGVKLHGWFVPGKSDLTLLWFHGNAGNISRRVDNIALLHERLGANIFIIDYRGYGRSEGSPSEQGLYLDAEAAIEYLRSREDVKDDRLVLFGRSLGGAVAVEMAVRHQVYALIIESSFTSVKAMAKGAHPVLSRLFPVGAVVRGKYDSLSKIKEVRSPVLVIHGNQDEIVPYIMGQELYDAANEPKTFYSIEGSGHNDTYIVGGNAYFDALRRFLEGS